MRRKEGQERGIEKPTDKFMLRHVKRVILAVRVILADHKEIQTIRGSFEARVGKRTRHVQVL